MPAEWLPYVPFAALVTSVIALMVSGMNLGWSIYKELALRGRVRVSFRLSSIHHDTFPEPLTRLIISVTNLGPGKVRLSMLQLRTVSWWRRLLRRCAYSVLIHDYEHPLGGKLPYTLDVGEGLDFTLSIEDSFLEKNFTHVGVSDSFGRIHWCPAIEMRQARRDLASFRTKAST